MAAADRNPVAKHGPVRWRCRDLSMKRMRLPLIAFFCLVAPGIAAANDDENIFPRKIDCGTSSEPKNCKAHQRLLPLITAGALGGRRASMRAVARYAGEFATDIFVQDMTLSCAWRMVIVGSPRLRSTADDQSAYEKTCSPLSSVKHAEAEETAKHIAKRVFRANIFALPGSD